MPGLGAAKHVSFLFFLSVVWDLPHLEADGEVLTMSTAARLGEVTDTARGFVWLLPLL